jgi:hypothetical protein
MRLPAVDGFWSLTMYDRHDFMLVPNPIGRFAIGDRTPGLRPGDDGSLTLYIQHAMPVDPAAQANWPPAPTGSFYLCLRAYPPRAADARRPASPAAGRARRARLIREFGGPGRRITISERRRTDWHPRPSPARYSPIEMRVIQ